MSYLILFILLTIVPFICGLLPACIVHKNHRSLLATYVYGWFVMFALFQVTSTPLILLKSSFSKLVALYGCLLLLVMIIGMFTGRKALIDMIRINQQNKTCRTVKIAWLVMLLIIAAQMLYLVFHQYTDGDDAYYISVAVDAVEKDTMYLTNAYIGYPQTVVDIRHALSPVPIFMAFLSRISGIHPTVIAHSVMAPVLIGLMYAIYTLLGRRLLREHREYTPVFLLFINVFYVFGHVSLYTAETFAYTRTWQGKSMLANLVIPFIYLALLSILDEDSGFGEWLLLFFATLASVFTTSVSVFFAAVLFGISFLFFLFRRRRSTDVAGFMICVTTCIVFGVLYIIQ